MAFDSLTGMGRDRDPTERQQDRPALRPATLTEDRDPTDVVRLESPSGVFELHILGYESPERDRLGQRWLVAIAGVETNDPVLCDGRTHLPLTTDDLQRLADGLRRFLPKHVGGVHKHFSWETRDDELELAIAWKGNRGRMKGRVESGAAHVDLTITFEDFEIRRPTIASAVAALDVLVSRYGDAPSES